MIAGIENQICLENDIIPAIDNYIIFPNINSHCLEDDNMVLKECEYCKMVFDALVGQLNIGRAKYCSVECRNKSQIGKKHTDEHKRKIGLGGRGRIKSEKEKRNISVGKSGWIPSEETRKRMSIAREGIHLSDETKRRMAESRKGSKNPSFGKRGVKSPLYHRKYSEEHKRKMSENHADFTGTNNPCWNGGSSFLPYCYKFNKELKEYIRERDNRTCQLCDIKENGQKLSVHHVHYDKENCEPDLISLCPSCSGKVNFNRDYYEELFMNKLKNKGIYNESILNKTAHKRG